MCSGAMMHARLARIVFGARDPKTGTAGSVLDLFAHPQLNHHARVDGGVMAVECGTLLADFFRQRRQDARALHPLRDDALRTPEARFSALAGFDWTPRYVSDLPSLGGLRLHYIDEGPRDASRTWLCLHGPGAWSCQFRDMIPALLRAGDRVVAVDLPGFGRSDKPKKESAHDLGWHLRVLCEFVQQQDLRDVEVVQAAGFSFGKGLLLAQPARCRDLMVVDLRADVAMQDAFDMPFPDRGHRAALRAFEGLEPPSAPTPPEDGAAAAARALQSIS